MAKKNLQKKRKSLEDQYTQTTFKRLKSLNALAKKAESDPDAIFSNLMRILSDEGVLYQAMGTISKKDGALTPGTFLDTRTADAASQKLISEISEQIKLGTFRFKPIRRIYLAKSGQPSVSKEQLEKLKQLHGKGKVTMDQIKQVKVRPIGIPSFPDKIVQEAIRMILNAIYEPEFAKLNLNFGFRPKYGCHNAILQIQQKAKQMDYAIEGDITGAFDNVNHSELLKILNKKVKDEKFLKLINGGLKCGVIFLNFRQDSDIGTTQGSIVSPLLYNIYFHEFDKLINTEFRKIIENLNIAENRKDKPINKLYNFLTKKKTMLKLKSKLEDLNTLYNTLGKEDPIVKKLSGQVKQTSKTYKEIDKIQKKVPSYAKSRQTIRFAYTRYADDWVFFTNATAERTYEWKELFSQWIAQNLKLTLSEEKTKITNLRNGEAVRFLGFQLRRQTRQKITTVGSHKFIKKDIARRRVKQKVAVQNSERKKMIHKIRATNPSLIIGWDRERVLPRLESNGFIKKSGNTWRGKSKLPWTTLMLPEIIERYNFIIRGYIQYFTPVVDYPTDTQFLHYLLSYSCAHTIAQKGNTTLGKIFKKYGKDLKINYKEETSTKKPDGTIETTSSYKSTKLLSWDDCMKIISDTLYKVRSAQKEKKTLQLSTVTKAVDDICKVKIN